MLTRADVTEVVAWGTPPEALKQKDDAGLNINGRFRLTSGLECQVFGLTNEYGSPDNSSGVNVWTDDTLISWQWNAPRIFKGFDAKGTRLEIDPKYAPFPWTDISKRAGLQQPDSYLVSSIRSFIDSVKTGSKLWVSGHDLRQALEVAIACKHSARLGNAPMKLPLVDRSLELYPRPFRWLGGDAIGKPQSASDAAGD